MPSRYLVIAPQGLGDALEATPLIAALRACDNDCVIDVVVTRRGPEALFLGLPDVVDNVIPLPYWDAGILSFGLKLASLRRRERYDASFLAFPAARRAYRVVQAAVPAKRRFAHDWNAGAIDRVFGITSVPVRLVHNVERNLDLLRAYGIEARPTERYMTPEAWRRVTAEDRDRIIVHLGSINHDGLAAKRWPVANFTELCKRLRERGYPVLLLAGPDEREDTLLCAREAGGLPVFEGALDEAARLLASSGVVVANDNGIAHLAAGLGTPVVSLFGPTPIQFAPYAPDAIALRPSSCPPCFDVRKPVVTCVRNIDFACLKRDLTVEAAMDAIATAASVSRGRNVAR